MTVLMETTKQIEEEIPPMKKGQLNTYKPEDIKRWGVERFLEATAVREPFNRVFPEFTEEENRIMDELLAEGDRGQYDIRYKPTYWLCSS